ncbi:hypothetical protein [Saccharothrix yanglingensis]|uniref:hypothetical protein n=1 Tax=Saccharothrix yanglingensis TaxID=659496 RepID=UPI0027D240E0|nr:hypothetical protein [Saccharothrix yanglingensis]
MAQSRLKVKPVLADRMVAALRVVEQDTTLLYELGDVATSTVQASYPRPRRTE